MNYEVQAIGKIEGARDDLEDDYWGGQESCIVLSAGIPPEALQGIETFSHVEVLFLFDRVAASKVVLGARHPRNNRDWPEVGIFAQRAKARPNRIGSTICRVMRSDGPRLYVAELDAVAGTPVLDLKPVMAEFLPRGETRQPDWSRELMSHYWERKA
jgi:tRNA (Thr-GGU) A37 N-methylase